MRQMACAAAPNRAASPVPPTVPKMAHRIFFPVPPNSTKLTTVTYTQSPKAVHTGSAPFISIGQSTQITQMTVRPRPKSDFRPVRPPTSTTTAKNTAKRAYTAQIRSYS